METVDGPPLELHDIASAPPCVEFSRFCLGQGFDSVEADVRQALLDLDGGARGFYARTDGLGTVTVGARLWAGRLSEPPSAADQPGPGSARLPGRPGVRG